LEGLIHGGAYFRNFTVNAHEIRIKPVYSFSITLAHIYIELRRHPGHSLKKSPWNFKDWPWKVLEKPEKVFEPCTILMLKTPDADNHLPKRAGASCIKPSVRRNRARVAHIQEFDWTVHQVLVFTSGVKYHI